MSFTVRNHYVPQWYQRRFLQGASQYWYLDLKPDVIKRPDGSSTTRKALRHLGPINCFEQEHLYTLFFGEYATDVMERRFFGDIDARGEKAVPFFENYSYREGVHEAFEGFLHFMSAQLFRTPKGLALIRAMSGTSDDQRNLHAMLRLWELYKTIWTEAVWEIVACKQSETKFLVTDHPVTTYNRMVYPGSTEVRKFGLARFERIGTHTIFPVDSNHCLILTNLQYVRNPKIDPLKLRENPRYYGQTMFDLRKVQRGRELDEEEVIAINYVLKRAARRYVAAANREWLYPERRIGTPPWPKIGGKYFLSPDPRKVDFHTSTLVGFKDGGAWGINEYGHRDLDGPRAQTLRSVEWKTFQASKRAWDERDRRAGRPPPDLTEYR